MFRDAEMMWSPGSLPGNINSHPDRSLTDHLEGAAVLALRLAERHGLDIDACLLRKVCETHDLGKANPDWQDYLFGKRGKGPEHALPSSYFTWDSTKNIWAVETVRRHHTFIEDTEVFCKFWIKREEDLQGIQAKMKKYVPSWQCLSSQVDWESFIDSLWDLEINSKAWLLLRSMYSLLVTADRMDAIGVSSLEFLSLSEFYPMDFEKNGCSPLDGWRKKTRGLCLKKAREIEKPGLFTLTLPTGAGKTTVGLEIAHLLARKWKYETIIYALPFISIIEQNAAVARTLFGNDSVQEDHSLGYGKPAEENRGDGSTWSRMSALFRYWRTPVVLTTMVQLWDAIFDPHANASMDFHRLSRAVVVMDEPQGIDPRLWEGFGRVLSFLTEKWGTTFILMTATQPHIGQGEEIAPPDNEIPFNRHKFSVSPEKMKLKELPDLLQENLSLDHGSGLVVLNTKKAALEVFKMFEDRQFFSPLLFLSAWMAPKHRRRIMRYLNYLEKKERRRYLVSTQVVEAGVDLDFDLVFRDMGPLDSIIQVAGRCNRHMKRETPGNVLIADLVGDKDRSYCEMIYDDILLLNTRDILRSEKDFDEKRVPDLVSKYYSAILEGLAHKPIWENIEGGLWGPDKKEELIKDKEGYQNETVFVELDRHIRPILDRLRNTKWTLENLDEKKSLARKAQQYAIEVPLKELIKWRAEISNIISNDDIPPLNKMDGDDYWFISRAAIMIDKPIYSRITGFVPIGSYERDTINDPFI